MTNPRFKKNLIGLLKSSALWCRLFNKKLSPTASTLGAGGATANNHYQQRNSVQSTSLNTKRLAASIHDSQHRSITNNNSTNTNRRNRRHRHDDSLWSRRRGDEKCLHYLLCFLCRRTGDSNHQCSTGGGENVVMGRRMTSSNHKSDSSHKSKSDSISFNRNSSNKRNDNNAN